MTSVVQPIPQSSMSCPECGGRPRETSDYMVCAECGLVLGDRITDTGPLSESIQRILPSIRMGSVMFPMRNRSGFTNTQSNRMTRLQMTASNIKSVNSMGHWSALLSQIQTRVPITETVRLRTLWVFEHMARGWGQRDRTPFLLGCLITAARELNQPVSLNRVCEFLPTQHGHHRKKKLNRALLYVKEHMNERVICLPAAAHLSRIVSSLRKNDTVIKRLVADSLDPQEYLSMIEREARVLLESTESLSSRGGSPTVLAASSCYHVDHSATGARVLRLFDFDGISGESIRGCQRVRKQPAHLKGTVTHAILRLVTTISQTPRTTLSEAAWVTKISVTTLKKALTCLRDAGVVDHSGDDVLMFCPQESPEALRTIEIIAHAKDWNDVLRVLVMDHLTKRFKTTSRDLVHLNRVRTDIRNRLPFLKISEYRSILREVIDDLCINGILRLVDGEVYRFSL